MIAALLAPALLQVAPPQAPRSAEAWKPWLSWACLVRAPKGKPFVLNGIVARRNRAGRRAEHMQDERALRVLRDDSGALAGLQAWSPLLVVRPTEFWATFYRSEGGTARHEGRMTLKVPQTGGRGSVDLFNEKSGTKPYATGPCLSRVEPRKAQS